MSEWWTYRLSDFLMFAPRTYYRLFELTNAEVWPLQFVAIIAGLAMLWLVWRGAYGRVDVPGGAAGHPVDDLLRGGVDDLDGFAGGRSGPATSDVQLTHGPHPRPTRGSTPDQERRAMAWGDRGRGLAPPASRTAAGAYGCA